MAGDYLLSITAQDGFTGTLVNTLLWYGITGGPPLTAVAVTASPATPQQVDTPITFTATATGGSNVQYQFWLYNANATPAWTQLQGYTNDPYCAWTPTTAGNYVLSATALDGVTGTGANALFGYTVTSGPPLTAVSVTNSPASPQQSNTPITLTATATGGTNVTYKFWQYDANTTPAWTQLQAYSTTPTCLWQPAAAGDYLLSITARDGATGVEVNTMEWYAISNSPPLLAVVVSASPASLKVNTPVTFTATPAGGMNVSYQFWLYNANANPAWVQLQAYSTQPTCVWTPKTAGTYVLSVTAVDGVTGAFVNNLSGYTVQQ